MGLGGSACSECVPELTCHFRPPEHVPRVSAGPRTPGGIPVCQGAESTRKDPRPREKKMTKGEKHTVQDSPSVYVENRHAGTTAEATANLCWVKHVHRSSKKGVPAEYY